MEQNINGKEVGKMNVIKKIWVAILTIALVLVEIILPVKEKVMAETKNYGISSPVIKKDVILKEDETDGENGKLKNPVMKGTVVSCDTITFGVYPQSEYTPKQKPKQPVSGKEYTDSDGTKMVYKNQKYFKVEPIRWRVLSVDGDDAFLVSEKNLDYQAYNNVEEEVTWETCTLRVWLNKIFMNTAFTMEEQEAVKTTIVKNDNTVEDGAYTEDKVYLLSAEEVCNKVYGFNEKLYVKDEAREATNTEYVSWRDGNMGDADKGDAWWLRSLSTDRDCVSIVEGHGDGCYACDVDEKVSVRPALHLKLSDSALWHLMEKININTEIVSSWDTIMFGAYPQSKYIPKKEPENPQSGKEYTDSDGTKMVFEEWVRQEYDENEGIYKKVKWQGYFKVEPIKWRVLCVKENDVILLADKNLDVQKYNEEESDVTWENCTLRTWLNKVFFAKAFNQTQQEAVKNTKVVNDDNLFSGTAGGNNTMDKVYLLSIAEASNTAYGFNEVFEDESKTKAAKNTEYVKEHGELVTSTSPEYPEYMGNGNWWLRSPGGYNYYAAGVEEDCYGREFGFEVDSDWIAVRPVLHLNLSSNVWKYAGKITSIGTETEENETPAPTPTVSPTSTSTPTITSTPVPTEKISPIVNRENNTSIVSSTPKDTVIAPSKVTLTTAKNIKGAKIILKWKKVAGANGYQLQYATNKKFKAKKTKLTAKMKYTVKKLKKKKTYYVRVRAYTVSAGKKLYGKWSSVKKIKIKK